MKFKRFFVLLTAATITLSAGALTGCDKVKEAAGNVKDAVTSMADQVNNFDSNVDAGKLDDVLRNFYAGIKSGTVNETTRGQYVTAELPAHNATTAQKADAASKATVFSALEDQGMTSHFTEEYIQEFVSVNGEIKPKNAAVSEAGAAVPLTYNTTIATALGLS